MELIPFLQKIPENNFTEETLHNFRLDVKQLRYTAEAARSVTAATAASKVTRSLRRSDLTAASGPCTRRRAAS